jgi:acylphosphatase
MSRSVDVTVTGRVQGVFFRASAIDEARRLGVAGWVRNEPDGSIAAHLEGPTEAVDEMVAWCRTGPPHARVARVTETDAPASGATDFTVRY